MFCVIYCIPIWQHYTIYSFEVGRSLPIVSLKFAA